MSESISVGEPDDTPAAKGSEEHGGARRGDAHRERVVRAAATEWIRRLVNLDGHNRMLYFRELMRGTLEVSPTHPAVRAEVLESLLAGSPIVLSDLIEPSALEDAALRLLALDAKAKSNFEEKGLSTLYIGHSFASWRRPDGHEPRAPVVLLPTRIRLKSLDGTDAFLELSGEAELNPSLVYALGEDLGAIPYPDASELSHDFRQWVEDVEQAAADAPEFALDDRLFLANFEFSNLPMVVDIEQNMDLLVQNDVVAAIAGDESAAAGLRTELSFQIDLPDVIPPADEYLVCDADASQNYAVTSAVLGQCLVVHGPPGTGKSQTIANMISALAAEGKSVLFVAEKRAAIGAVMRRLEEAGCPELVLDLHDGTSRRDVVKSIAESVQGIGSWLTNQPVPPHAELAVAREKLVAHRSQMHGKREPSGMSFFELQAMLGTPDHELTGLRLSKDVLELWTAPGREKVKELLVVWRRLAKRLDKDPTGLWSASRIQNPEDAKNVCKYLDQLVTTLIPAAEDAHRAALAELGAPIDSDIEIGDLSAFINTVDELVERYPPLFFAAAENLAIHLAPATRSTMGRAFSRLTDPEYRRARRRVGELGLGHLDPRVVLQDARTVEAAEATWASWFPGQPLPTRGSWADRLASTLANYEKARDRLVDLVPAFSEITNTDEQSATLKLMRERPDLADLKVVQHRSAERIADFGLTPLLSLSNKENRAEFDIVDMAFRVFAASAIDDITWHEPELARFDGASHQKAANAYLELDRRHLNTSAQRVMGLVAQRAAAALREHAREAAIVEHEIAATKYHAPTRQLLATAPNVLKALRPCWAISPRLVSRMLADGDSLFDVVVFDEGSQILPIHAIPAIARGKQVVVAGDQYQLPPSQFNVSESLADQLERVLPSGAAPADDAESILDVMLGLVEERTLLWHYRSQDERLINFSNTHIYSGSLVSFPGVNRGTGISHRRVDHVPEHPDGTSSNPEVVRLVVNLILEHAIEHPGESLGVIASGPRHANDIDAALRAARLKSEVDYGGFFEEKGAEPFFVKTMDLAQGDERDHIILSVGFGRNPSGDVVYRWGGLNRRGGERRLNVAVTRSKRRMTVVSAIGFEDIDPVRTTARGSQLLCEYLEYAERAGESIVRRDTQPPTPFEKSVSDRLSAAGIPFELHHGGGRHRIDFGAFADHGRTRPVLAIETDGLGYNSSDTVRDRDRLRLEVLRGRGWRHHRLWSIDWYRDPDGETSRVREAWESAVRDSQLPTRRVAQEAAHPIVPGRGRSPIPIRRTGILGYQRHELVKLVTWIESDGVTRTEDELVSEMLGILGFEDARGRIGHALRGAIGEARS